MFAEFKDRSVLLLQGPLGPFFRRLADDLEEAGARVTKVNFCGGDLCFYHRGDTVLYRGKLADWPAFASNLLDERKIDAIFLLGDLRPYHFPLKAIAKEKGINWFVFEEGYLRPNFITLEQGGVNGNSLLPRDSHFYLTQNKLPQANSAPIGVTRWHSFAWAMFYYLFVALLWWFFPRYKHHRHANFVFHGLCFIRNGYRILKYRYLERNLTNELVTQYSHKYYLFPLQVHNDYQFKHSKFARIEDCMDEVIKSFAQHINSDHILVIKHHPADLPYRDYTRLIQKLARQHNVQQRIRYVHNLHLPTLLKNAIGTILMNSTVGIASLHYKTPVKVLGRAVYDIPGLTFQGSLAEFWINPGDVDKSLYKNFRGWLEYANQANGNFYRRLSSTANKTGVHWFPRPLNSESPE